MNMHSWKSKTNLFFVLVVVKWKATNPELSLGTKIQIIPMWNNFNSVGDKIHFYSENRILLPSPGPLLSIFMINYWRYLNHYYNNCSFNFIHMVDKSTSRITKQKEHLQISVHRGGVSQKTVKIKKKETNIPQYIKRKKTLYSAC